jgi:hypothetical protein
MSIPFETTAHYLEGGYRSEIPEENQGVQSSHESLHGEVTGVNQVRGTDSGADTNVACCACVMRDVDAWELSAGAAVT